MSIIAGIRNVATAFPFPVFRPQSTIAQSTIVKWLKWRDLFTFEGCQHGGQRKITCVQTKNFTACHATHTILMIGSWTTIYAVYNAILLAEMRNWNPVLGAFPNIWLHERLAFSVLELLETVNFSAVLGAYEVKEQLPSGLFVVEMLVDGYSLFDIPLFCSAIDIFPLYMM